MLESKKLAYTPDGYIEVTTAHRGRLFHPADQIAEVLNEFSRDLQEEVTVMQLENNFTKADLVRELVHAGYPTDFPASVFKPLDTMTNNELATMLHSARHTLHLQLWGDHGPVDGKSHVMFVQSIRFHRFQFKRDLSVAKVSMIQKKLDSSVKIIMICHMTSALAPTLGAANFVGTLYKDLYEGRKVKVSGDRPQKMPQGVDDRPRQQLNEHAFNAVIRWCTGDLKWQSSIGMLQQGGSGPDSYVLPSSYLSRKEYVDYAK